MNSGWMRVEAPHFVAGLDYRDGRVTKAAPILNWARGKPLEVVRGYFDRKGWRYTLNPEGP